jgi:cytochrome bd ubiquinol oxidase subunit I
MAPSAHLMAYTVAWFQPVKLAALEGHYQTGTGGTGMCLFGIPDPEGKNLLYAIEVPDLLSLLVYGDPNKPVKGLDIAPKEDWPPLVLPFIAYRVMIAIFGVLSLLIALGAWHVWRRTLDRQRTLLWAFQFAVVLPYIANQAGWICAEVGRQPWVVYGVMRRSDAYSNSVPAHHIVGSICMFAIIYSLLLWVFISVLHKKIMDGPDAHTEGKLSDYSDDIFEVAGRRVDKSHYSMTDIEDKEAPGDDETRT